MATYTSYLNLEKPAVGETFNLLKINQNWDKIDAGVSALNSKMENRPIGEVVGVSGTTTSAGQIEVTVLQSYMYAYVVSNLSEQLSNPYSVTVSQINNTTHKITLRIRNMGDNLAVANTQVGFDALIVGK